LNAILDATEPDIDEQPRTPSSKDVSRLIDNERSASMVDKGYENSLSDGDEFDSHGRLN